MSSKQLIRFLTDANGLEKILRLLQSLAQILGSISIAASNVLFYQHLRRQFALGRRYFRFFRWLDCVEKGRICFEGEEGRWEVERWFGVGKWGFLGAYLALESCCLLDAMGVWPTPWAEVLMLEANRFWFYSLVVSIVWGGLQILVLQSGAREEEKEDEKKKSMGYYEKKSQELKRKLVTDVFDLFIPGHVTGWIRSSSGFVGFASVVSTTLSMRDVWDRLR